jgi:hypothetical protein
MWKCAWVDLMDGSVVLVVLVMGQDPMRLRLLHGQGLVVALVAVAWRGGQGSGTSSAMH